MEQTNLFPSKVAEVYVISYDRINSPVFSSKVAARKYLPKKSKVKPWVNSVWSYKKESKLDLEQYTETVPDGFSLVGVVVYAQTQEHEWGYYPSGEDAKTNPALRNERGFRTTIIPVLKLDDIKKE